MFAFKNTAFLASLVTCGVMLCSATYYAHSTAIESGLLSDKQLSEIYGGREIDCTETDEVEGCRQTILVVKQNKAIDWEPPVKGDDETTEKFSQRYLASIPECPDGLIDDISLGASAEGDDAENDGVEKHCLFMYPYNRSDVVENAVAGGDFGEKTKCISDPTSTMHCVVCEPEDDRVPRAEKMQKMKCPENNGG